MPSSPARVVAWDTAAVALMLAARIHGGTGDSGLVVDGLRLDAGKHDVIRWDLERAVGLAKSPGARCSWRAHPADPRFGLMIAGGAAEPTAWFFSASLPAPGNVVPIRHPASRLGGRQGLVQGRSGSFADGGAPVGAAPATPREAAEGRPVNPAATSHVLRVVEFPLIRSAPQRETPSPGAAGT